MTVEQTLLQSFHQHLPGLAPQTIDAMRQVMRVYTVPAETMLTTQGEATNSLFLVESGQVAVFYEGNNGERSDERLLADLTGSVILGEMALLDGKPRSASVRTLTECRLMELRPSEIQALPGGDHVLADLRSNLAMAVTNRMREQTSKYVASMEREMKAIKERQHFGQFFIYTLGLMTIGMLVNDILAKQVLKLNIFTPTFAWVYLLIIMVPTSFVIWRMKIPLSDLGVTLVGIKKSLREGAALSAALMVLAFSAAWILGLLGIKTGTPVPADWAGTSGYFFHSVLQELIARGLMQSSFQRFLGDDKGLRSVVLASVLFGIFHIHFGLLAVVTTIVSGLMFGLLYLRHRNLAGVTLVHFFAGAAAFWSGLI